MWKHDRVLRRVLAVIEELAAYLKSQRDRRHIGLHVAEVRFHPQPMKGKVVMATDNIGIDVPAGQFAAITFAPKDENGKKAKLDGPLEAAITDPVGPDFGGAKVVVGGPDGLTVHIQPPDADNATVSVEVDGDADLDPAARDVVVTLITARRIPTPAGKAVTLGGDVQAVAFRPASEFGQF